MSFKFNPFTGTFDIVNDPVPNKIEYINEDITVLTNTFLVLVEPILSGTSTITLEGTATLKVL